jgi:DNA-binding transcriptional regulator YiaG
MNMPTQSILKDLKGLRQQSQMNQSTFWTRYGVTQSGGSRYESGRELPAPLAILLILHTQARISDEALAAALEEAKATGNVV